MSKSKVKKIKPIYLLDSKLKWKVFKKLNDKLVIDSGPTPERGTKILWEMMRDRKIYCWYDPYIKNDMMFGWKLPRNRKVEIITNFKTYETKSYLG